MCREAGSGQSGAKRFTLACQVDFDLHKQQYVHEMSVGVNNARLKRAKQG
jgi:hypothetical protein